MRAAAATAAARESGRSSPVCGASRRRPRRPPRSARSAQHLGAHMLDGLKAADRLAELLAHLRVLDGGVHRHRANPAASAASNVAPDSRPVRPATKAPPRARRRGRRGPSAARSRSACRASTEAPSAASRSAATVAPAGGTAHRRGRPPARTPPHRPPGRRRIARPPKGQARSTFTGHQRLEHAGVVDHKRRQRARDNRTGTNVVGRLLNHRAQILDHAPAPPASSGTATPNSPSSESAE